MRKRTVVFITVVVTLSLLAVGVWAAELAKLDQSARVISGQHFGIRLEREQSGVMLGTLVVQVDGQWVQVQIAPTLTHAKP